MGQSFTKLSDWFIGKKVMRIIMAGLDYAGKTTILYKLKLGDKVEDTGHTIGFNVEDVEYNNIKFTIFDISRPRPMWKFFYESQALVFVVDSTDHERIGEAKDELHSMLKEDALKADALALLVFANKQDKPAALSVIELIDALDLRSVQCRWYVQSSCATCGEGLYEGLDWLVSIFSQE